MPKTTTNIPSTTTDKSDPDLDLKRVGLKVTHPRLRILRLLEESDVHHLSAEDVYRRLVEDGDDVGIPIATVYRVLTQFEAAGLIVRHNFGDGASCYELDHGEHHDHILCTSCGRVDEFVDEHIEKHQREVAERMGYEITDHALYIYGICNDCRDKASSRA